MADAYTGDRIILKDLGFYGYHGLMMEEKALGQRSSSTWNAGST